MVSSTPLRLLVIVLGVGWLGGCAALPAQSIERITQGDHAYRSGRYAAAEQLLTPVIETHPDKPDVGEALYLRALCRIGRNEPEAARKDLNQALHVTRRNELVDLIHTQLGNIEFHMGRYGPAATYYAQGYPDLPGKPPKDRVGYQYGLALQRMGRFSAARDVFEEVSLRFPRGEWAARARTKAAWAGDHFAIQCGAFRDIAGAHRQARELIEHGVKAVAIPETAATSKLYVVRVGRYHDYIAAQRALPLVQRHQPDAYIVP